MNANNADREREDTDAPTVNGQKPGYVNPASKKLEDSGDETAIVEGRSDVNNSSIANNESLDEDLIETVPEITPEIAEVTREIRGKAKKKVIDWASNEPITSDQESGEVFGNDAYFPDANLPNVVGGLDVADQLQDEFLADKLAGMHEMDDLTFLEDPVPHLMDEGFMPEPLRPLDDEEPELDMGEFEEPPKPASDEITNPGEENVNNGDE